MGQEPFTPYVPSGKSLPELTFQAIVLGILLSLVMCAANIYVGLKAGMTVSAAIPASVISMGILRGLLRRGTILENNVVHTIASSGESLAAGIIFTVPALVLAGIWQEFNYMETTLIAMSGGVMGVVMMIPLRRAMIVEQKELRYPEGVACAEVLKAGDRGGAEMLGIFTALGIGALFKVVVSVAGVLSEKVEHAWTVGRTALYVGSDVSPMLMAVGFIVGWEISALVFLGGAISFFGAIPILAWGVDFSGAAVADGIGEIWDTQIRFFGIGAMVVAGVYSIIKVAGSIGAGIGTALRGILGRDEEEELPRTEQGITGKALFTLMGFCLFLSGLVYYLMTESATTTVVITGIMFMLAFFFVAVASYIVGLVGSSNSPVSGMTICTVLITAGLLIVMDYTGTAGILATLGVAGVVCCAACTSGDICQDLKIGHIVGATPRRLQIGEILGTMIPAFIIAPTMTLLHKAYGIGTAASDTVDALPAPQAAMFEKLVSGLFGTGEAIPWNLVGYGAAVGIVAILIDMTMLQPRNTKFRLHAMPLAVGMYLPLTVTFPILLGGAAYWFVDRTCRRRQVEDETRKKIIHRGLLFSSGLVAGEAIMGIIIAVLLVTDLKIPVVENFADVGDGVPMLGLSVAALLFMIWLMIRKALR